ncbi:MAG: hypothetical protein HDS35_08950 [Bacteroides sp.]|nr:hypothetical protein [Bacteroides sp.]
MRKRKIPDNMPVLDLMQEPAALPKWNAQKVIALLAEKREEYTTEERELLVALTLLIRNKLLPDDYEIIFRLLSPATTIINMPGSLPPIHHLQIPPEIITMIKEAPDPADQTILPHDDLPFTFDP